MITEQEIHPKLQEALVAAGRLGRYTYAPPETREMLELTHNFAVYRVLISNDPLQLRGEKALITYFSTPSTIKQTAEIFRFSRETIRKGIQASLITRHQYLNPDDQSIYPLSEMLAFHHNYLPPEHRLLIANNMGSRIIDIIETGANFDQLLSSLKIGRSPLKARLRLLRTLGIDIPKIPNSPIEHQLVVANLRDQTKTDKEVQFFLNQVTQGIYHLNLEAEEPFLIAISNVAMEMGYHVYGRNAKEFIETAKAKVPVSPEFQTGIQKGSTKRYRFAVAWHKDRVKEAIQTNEEFDKYLDPIVEQISGELLPPRELPSSYQIINKRGFVRVGKVLLEIGIRPGSNNYKRVRQALSQNGYPDPSYLYQGILVIPENSRHSLQEFAKQILGNEATIPT